MTFCNLRRRTILNVSMGGVRAFADGLFSASVPLGSTFFVVQKVRAWLWVELCWTLRGFHISSTAAIDYTTFPVGIAVKTLLFGRIFANFEDLGLHATVFGKMASLSLERASNCTQILCFEGVSKYSCMARSLVSLDRMEFHPYHIHHPSDSL